MNFFTSLALPVSKQSIQLREMTMQEFCVLQKFLLEGNDNNVSQCFLQLATNCSNCDAHQLCNVDLFFLLCKLRSISIGDDITFSINDINIKSSLEQTLQRIEQLDFNFKQVVHYSGIKFELQLPNILNISNYADALVSVIYAVDDVCLRSLSHQNYQNIINKIPSCILTHCSEFIKQGLNEMQHHWFIVPNDSIQLPGININAFNNSLIEILKFIYKDDLMNVYNIKYVLANKLHISPQQADAMSPAECRVYISLYNDEISKLNKQLQEQQQQAKYNI